ncbi:MAG: hypothetical protein II040_04815 [Muribaculaceae bacterium]|nr:hypothetical protein [Muribaculaceae bacterium]
MTRLTLLMAAIICLATSALAQISENQTLSTSLWKQGIARCAHYTAYAKGFAKRSDEMLRRFPQGYTLDDLNEVYDNQGAKWEKIYDEFKQEEGKSGSIADLKELVTPQIWKLVEPDFNAFITDHPDMAQEAPAPEATDGEAQEGEQGDKAQANEGEANAAKPASSLPSLPACPANLPLWLSIIGLLLGLWALLNSLSNRGKIKEMRRNFAREIDRTNANLQEFSTDAADQMRALSIRLTGKAARMQEPVADDLAAINDDVQVADEETAATDGDVAPIAADDEVLNLFMSKPDDNDDFTRVSDTLEPGNSIFVLTTLDGQHGTFEVIDKPEVHQFALMMPAENLMRACSGNAIQIPSGNRIVTDRAGEAEYVDGRWHVVVKAIIHYEG